MNKDHSMKRDQVMRGLAKLDRDGNMNKEKELNIDKEASKVNHKIPLQRNHQTVAIIRLGRLFQKAMKNRLMKMTL